MSRRAGSVADWLIAFGAAALFVSLLLTWSHQFSLGVLTVPGARVGLRGVPADASAWQVYTVADVALATLAAALAAGALVGGRRFRLALLPLVIVGLVFSLHALSTPPTNGVRLLNPGPIVPAYAAIAPSADAGETVAIIALAVTLAGILLSLVSE